MRYLGVLGLDRQRSARRPARWSPWFRFPAVTLPQLRASPGTPPAAGRCQAQPGAARGSREMWAQRYVADLRDRTPPPLSATTIRARDVAGHSADRDRRYLWPGVLRVLDQVHQHFLSSSGRATRAPRRRSGASPPNHPPARRAPPFPARPQPDRSRERADLLLRGWRAEPRKARATESSRSISASIWVEVFSSACSKSPRFAARTRRRCWIPSRMGVSGFLISCATCRAISPHASTRTAWAAR